MKRVFFLLFLFAQISILLNANSLAPDQDKETYFRYYEDGIYDTIKQINKEAEEGLSEYPLDNQIKGNIVVAIEVGDMSVTDIVRMKTVAIKNNYTESITAKNLNNKKEYIVFDSFDREAEADYTIRRLADYGVNAHKVFGGKWVKNPITIKKIAGDLKNGLFANMPVKVVVIEKTIFKDDKEQIELVKNGNKNEDKKEKVSTSLQDFKTTKASPAVLRNLNEMIKAIKAENNFSFDNATFTFKGKEYAQGDMINDFKITKIYIKKYKNNKRKFVALFDNFYNYHLTLWETESKKDTLKDNNDNKQQNSEENTKKETQKVEADNGSKSEKINYYVCDFSKIRALHVPGVGTKRIKDTEYAFLENKKEKVLHVKEEDEYTLFKNSGFHPVGIRTAAWRKLCIPTK